MSKLVVIVQCELVTRRCSGYNCMKAFTQRSGKMEGYPEGTRYMEVVGIRAKPMPKPTRYNQEERAWLTKAKARYAIKQSEEEAERNYQQGVHKLFTGLMGMIQR